VNLDPKKAVPAPETAKAFPTLQLYVTLLWVSGWIVIGGGAIGGISLFFHAGHEAAGFGLILAGLVAGVGQFFLAELLTLLVQLKADVRYACERLHAIDQRGRSREH
jgi:hypothetical protein